jgi:hypothetical protein
VATERQRTQRREGRDMNFVPASVFSVSLWRKASLAVQ